LLTGLSVLLKTNVIEFFIQFVMEVSIFKLAYLDYVVSLFRLIY